MYHCINSIWRVYFCVWVATFLFFWSKKHSFFFNENVLINLMNVILCINDMNEREKTPPNALPHESTHTDHLHTGVNCCLKLALWLCQAIWAGRQKRSYVDVFSGKVSCFNVWFGHVIRMSWIYSSWIELWNMNSLRHKIKQEKNMAMSVFHLFQWYPWDLDLSLSLTLEHGKKATLQRQYNTSEFNDSQ